MLIIAFISFLFVRYYSDSFDRVDFFIDCTVDLLLLINVSSVSVLIRTLHIR